jgi:hypothetical protein
MKRGQTITGRRRERGIKTAAKLLTAKKLELNEISKQTLGSYVKKAVKDVDNAAYRVGRGTSRLDHDPVLQPDEDYSDDINDSRLGHRTSLHNNMVNVASKGNRRLKGISRATNRLVKEEPLYEGKQFKVKAGVWHPLNKGMVQPFHKTVDAADEKDAIAKVKEHIKSKGWKHESSISAEKLTTN